LRKKDGFSAKNFDLRRTTYHMKRIVLLPVLFLVSAFTAPKRTISPVGFVAISDGQKVFVNWTATNDRDYDYFTIEKSKDGVNFVPSLMVKGAGRIQNEAQYFDIDYAPFNGISYYRLKQTDYFGEVFYSEVIPVNFQLLEDGTIAPKPQANQEILSEITQKEALVVLRDIKGNDFITKVRIFYDNQELCAIDKRDLLAKGTYNVMATSYNAIFGKRLTIK
jgi:hypothetical protein